MTTIPLTEALERATKGDLYVWPTHWAGGSNSMQVNGVNTIWLESKGGGVVTLMLPHGGRVSEHTYANAALIAHCRNELPGLVEACVGLLELFDDQRRYCANEHEFEVYAKERDSGRDAFNAALLSAQNVKMP